jgi:hypothetical protein
VVDGLSAREMKLQWIRKVQSLSPELPTNFMTDEVAILETNFRHERIRNSAFVVPGKKLVDRIVSTF